jgi:enterobactin synthetase component D
MPATAPPGAMHIEHHGAAQAVEAGHFIDCVERSLPGQHAAMPYVLARFHLARFSSEQFALHAIDFPTHIRNSVPKRQAEFIAGRICAQTVLKAYGIEGQGVGIGGHREPVWPPGFVGSITHNGQYAAAVACKNIALLGMGMDIETVIDDDARAAMVELVVSATELAYLQQMAASGACTLGFDRLLTIVFSAKESFFKAAFAHVREYFDFDAAHVYEIDPARQLIRFRCVHALSAHLPRGRECVAYFELLDAASILTVVLLQGEDGAGVVQ